MDTLRDVMEAAFFDELEKIELEKTAFVQSLPAIGKSLAGLGSKFMAGGSGAQAAKFFGTRAAIGAGAGAAAGGATSRDGNFARGALRGALGGAAIGAGVGGAQAGRAAYQIGRGAMTGTRAPLSAFRTLRSAGVGRQGMRQGVTALKSGHWL